MDKHEAHIERLRGVAILAVVGYHAGLPGFSGGFVGVDVFFVVSGYLITGQLTRLKDAKKLNLAGFWLRRLARLAPAGVLVVLATAAASMFLLPPDRADHALAATAPSLIYAANLHFISTANNYHAWMTTMNPLLHMWSLGIEGQFYLFWPLLFLISPKFLRMPIIFLILSASFALSTAITPDHPVFAFYGLPTRLWELAAGALLALLGLRLPLVFGLLGLAAIGAAVVFFNADTSFPGYMAAVPVTGAIFIIAAHKSGHSSGIMEWIGARSYSWYLWHWPMIVFAELEVSGLAARITAVGLALVLSDVTYVLIEQPARKWGRQWAAM